jgi:hypothetical protein
MVALNHGAHLNNFCSQNAGVFNVEAAVNITATVFLSIKKDNMVGPCSTYYGNMKHT